MAVAEITIHVADLEEVRNQLGQLTLERDAAQAEAAELRDEIRMAYGRGRDDEADGRPLEFQ